MVRYTLKTSLVHETVEMLWTISIFISAFSHLSASTIISRCFFPSCWS